MKECSQIDPTTMINWNPQMANSTPPLSGHTHNRDLRKLNIIKSGQPTSLPWTVPTYSPSSSSYPALFRTEYSRPLFPEPALIFLGRLLPSLSNGPPHSCVPSTPCTPCSPAGLIPQQSIPGRRLQLGSLSLAQVCGCMPAADTLSLSIHPLCRCIALCINEPLCPSLLLQLPELHLNFAPPLARLGLFQAFFRIRYVRFQLVHQKSISLSKFARLELSCGLVESWVPSPNAPTLCCCTRSKPTPSFRCT